MAKFRIRIEPTRAGNFQIRYFNKGDVAGRDGTIRTVEKNERATINGKEYVGKNLANKYRDMALENTHLDNLGECNPAEPLQGLVDAFIVERENVGLSDRTIIHNKISLRAFSAETPAKAIQDLSRDLMQSWTTSMRNRKLANETILGRLSDARTFCNWLVALGKLSRSPFARPVNQPKHKVGNLMPKRKKTQPKFYTAADYMALSAAALKINRYAQLAFEIFHSCGLRKEELVSHAGKPVTADRAKWEDIQWGRNGKADLLIRAELTKTGESRIVPLDKGVLAMLGSRKSGPLIPLTRHQLDHYFARARAVAGLLEYTVTSKGRKFLFDIHGLRHTFAKNYLQRGAGNLASLRILMGHASIVSTQIYSQFEKAYFQEGVDRAYEQRLIEEKLAGESVVPLNLAGELQVNLMKRSGFKQSVMHGDALIKE